MGKKLLTGICIPLGIICLLLGCNDKIEPGTTESSHPATVKTAVAVAKISKQPFIYEAIGTITALNSSTLSGKIMGTVKTVNVKEGDAVKKGDILVALDDRQVAAALRQSEAALTGAQKAKNAAISARNAAQARANLARTTYERFKKLFQEESATRQEFDEAHARYLQTRAALSRAKAMVSAARSQVQQAKAAVSGAGVSRKDAILSAPYDGIVTDKMIDVGDLASPGTPLLTLEKTGGFQVEFLVPEHLIQGVQMGQTLDVTLPALANFPPITGTIKTIAPTADAKSRSFKVKMTLPESTMLRSGMFSRVRIPVGEGGMLLIPATAQVNRGQLTGYFLVDDKNMARFRLMRTGRHFKDQIEVISGLKPGSSYVISPPAELKDGMKVERQS